MNQQFGGNCQQLMRTRHEYLWNLASLMLLIVLAQLAAAQKVTKASILTPAPGTILTAPAQTFTWTEIPGAQAYQLDIGTSQGARDIFAQNAGTAASLTVNSIPPNCQRVYVRLSTLLNGNWEYNDYIYDGCGQSSAQVSGTAGTVTPASSCTCDDLGSLRHRLEEVLALKNGLEAKLQTLPDNTPATREAWLSMQNELRGSLPQLSYNAPATQATIAMFDNYLDPVCGAAASSINACMDQVTTIHQQVHDPSCRAGRWNGQQAWTTRTMIQEEITANQAEIDRLQPEIAQIACKCSSFAVVVQVITASALATPGIVENSSRSLNGQQGILVPLAVNPDGTFQGYGSGNDNGSAAAYAAGGSATSQFGHSVSVQASGVIRPGTCGPQPCQPDMMHLVLSGFGGPQTTNAQARFPGYSRDLHQVTGGGAGAVEFDLPAYSGQSAQRVLFSIGPVNSNMTVSIVSADGTQGSSLLVAAQQCRAPSSGVPTQVAGNGPTGGGAAVGVAGGVSPGNSGNTQNQPTIPTMPDWVKITMTPSATQAGNVRLDWSAVDGAQSYNIYRNLSYVDAAPNEKVVGTVPAGTTSFTDTSVPLFIAAYYSVSAVNAIGESDRRQAPVTRAVATPDAPVWGFADTHTHPFVDRAFGGRLFWGRPFGPMTSALADCGNVHQTRNLDAGAVVVGVVLGGLLGPAASLLPVGGPVLSLGLGPLLGPILGDQASNALQVIHPGTKGSPTFDSWPRFDTKVHQMMYESWLYRAYVGGLRLIVAHAINNETMCEGLKGIGNIASSRSCDDMEAVSLQLQDARDMESFINNECASGDFVLGCVAPSVGWFHVVTSSTEARQTINRGQLAVVLGIEVDHPFGCGRTRACSKTDVNNALQALYDSGVRHLFPIHLSDNPFGGMAFYADMFAASSQILNGTPVVATECPIDQIDGAYTFHLTNFPQATTCNIQGLTDLGKYLVQNLANRHMIIDVDHMSRNSVQDTFTLLTPFQYPVISGHNTLMYLHQGGGRTEAARTTEQVMTIKSLGGVISIGTGDVGTVKDVGLAAQSHIPHNCSNSSQTWFQSYVRAVALTGESGGAAIALSTDQGLTDMIGPRFKGSIGEACAGGDSSEADAQNPATRVRYPFLTLTPGTPLPLKQSSVSGRTFDFNTEGMAHFGLFPDFVQDLRSQGVTDQELAPLFRSAEAYLQMWNRAEQTMVPIPAEHAATPVQGSIVLQIQSGSSGNSSWAIVNASDSLTGSVIQGTVMVNGGNGVVTGTTGTKITFPNCYEVSGVGSQKTKTVTACTGKVTASGYNQVTFSAPQ